MLVGRSICKRELLDLVHAGLLSGLQNSEGDGLGAFYVVIDWHHGSLSNGCVALQHAFDIRRIDIFAAGNEHVVGTADKIMEAVFVSPKYIARNIETVISERRLQVRAVVISIHQGRIFHLQHALFCVPVLAIYETERGQRMGAANRQLWP